MKHRNGLGQRKARYHFHFRPRVEMLEDRVNPSISGLNGFPLRMEVVALHEFGHALGLSHIQGQLSIMNPEYNPEYNLDYFASGSDPAVALLQALYSPENVANGDTPWRDGNDSSPGDNVVQITYSFGFNLMEGMNAQFGSNLWTQSLSSALNLWAGVSGGAVTFEAVSGDDGAGNFHIDGGAFDGPGGGVAFASSSGAIFFDMDENWGLIYTIDHTAMPIKPPHGHGEGEPGQGGGDGEAFEGLYLPVGARPIVVRQTLVVAPVVQRDLTAMAEVARQFQTGVLPVFSPVVSSFQVRSDAAAAAGQAFSVPATSRVASGQSAQVDLYRIVFLPVLNSSTSAEEATENSPASSQAQQPEASNPAANDPGVQTQTLQIQQQPAREARDEDEPQAGYSFDSGTALAGAALILGGYWAVPQEERDRRKGLRR